MSMKTLKASDEFVVGKNNIRWVSDRFKEAFGETRFTEVKEPPPFKKLEKWMYDKDIKNEFGAQECELGDILALIKNPTEEMKDGYWNIFYAAGCAVRVNWDSGSREWRVRAGEPGDHRWFGGDRVFSRNWHLEPLPSPDPLSLELRVKKLETVINDMAEVLKNVKV